MDREAPIQPAIDFDLSIVPVKERFQFWHDVGSQVQRPLSCKDQTSESLKVCAKLKPLGQQSMLGQMVASPQRFERTTAMIKRDHVDSFMLVLIQGGTMHWRSDRKQFQGGPGDLFLLNQQESFLSEWSEHRQIYAVLPRDLFTASGWPPPTTGLLRHDNPCTTLLRPHLEMLWNLPLWQQQGNSSRLALGLASLVSIYFNQQPSLLDGGMDQCEDNLLPVIQQWLDRHLHRSELDAATIAANFHISRSSLYELFQPLGGVRAYIKSRRLEQARQILRRGEAGISIGKLAKQLGFRSLSSFSRAYHDRWGTSAREERNLGVERSNHSPDHGEDWPSNKAKSVQQLKAETEQYYATVRNLSGRPKAAKSISMA